MAASCTTAEPLSPRKVFAYLSSASSLLVAFEVDVVSVSSGHDRPYVLTNSRTETFTSMGDVHAIVSASSRPRHRYRTDL